MLAFSSLAPLTPHTRVLAVVFGLVVIVWTLELVRRRRLHERYAFLWLAVGAVVLVVAAWPGLLGRLSSVIGARTAAVGLLALGGLGVLLLILHLTVTVSRQSEQIARLAEDLAVATARLDAVPPLQEAEAPGEAPDDAAYVDAR